jgi:hypothetical protein
MFEKSPKAFVAKIKLFSFQLDHFVKIRSASEFNVLEEGKPIYTCLINFKLKNGAIVVIEVKLLFKNELFFFGLYVIVVLQNN